MSLYNQDELEKYIKKLIEEDRIYKFYKTKEWLELRAEVLRDNHYECEICRSKGIITKAVIVHHVQFVRKYPRLALSKNYYWNGKRYKNLMSVCHTCHEQLHSRCCEKEEYKNEERWD